jgi:hypothetical protein
VPDCYIGGYGIHVWFETKTPFGKLSRIQKAVIAKMRNKGLTVVIPRSIDDVRQSLKENFKEVYTDV